MGVGAAFNCNRCFLELGSCDRAVGGGAFDSNCLIDNTTFLK